MLYRSNSSTFFGLTFLCLVLCSSHLSAQKSAVIEGYYISIQGDSVTGSISFAHFNYSIFLFKPSSSTNWVEILPKDMQRAGSYGGIFIIPHEIRFRNELRKIYLLRVVDGLYDLYESKTPDMGYLYFINTKDRPELLWVNKLAMKPQLTAYFGKCASALPARMKYNLASLKSVVQKIDNCFQPDAAKTIAKPKFKPQFGAGLNVFAHTSKPYVNLERYDRTFNGGGGIVTRLKLNPAISIDLGLNYLKKGIRSDSVEDIYRREERYLGADGTYYTDYFKYFYRHVNKFNFNLLQIPLGATVDVFPHKKTSLIVSGGGIVVLPLFSKAKESWGEPYLLQRNFIPAEVTGERQVYMDNLKFDKNINLSLYVGIGISRKIKSNREIAFLLGYYRSEEKVYYDVITPTSIGNYAADIQMNRFQLTATYTFFMVRNR